MPSYYKWGAPFWEKVSKGPEPDSCWEWMGSRNAHGYGQTFDGTRPVLAHRVAFAESNGSIPAGMGVLHRCDNPPCVRPDHLFLGDQTVNMGDAKRKGRVRRGESSAVAKLTAAEVLAIRERYRPIYGAQEALAREFGVNASTIRKIVKRQRWAHI